MEELCYHVCASNGDTVFTTMSREIAELLDDQEYVDARQAYLETLPQAGPDGELRAPSS